MEKVVFEITKKIYTIKVGLYLWPVGRIEIAGGVGVFTRSDFRQHIK
jgi:hypothetical protein